MSKRQLKDKAIDIKGKDYVLVSDRVNYFTDTYPNGSIQTELLSPHDSDTIVIKATVIPDVDKPERRFIDHAQELVGSSFINKTSAMENASTSAVGRALGFMGIGVLESIASADEINKATNRQSGTQKKATEKQIKWIYDEIDRKQGITDADKWFEEVFGRKVQDVPVYQVKQVVDKIKAYEKKSEPLNVEGLDKPITLDDIPY